MSAFKNEKIWRILTNFWTAIFIAFLILNFFSFDKYEFLIAPFSVVYASVLGLYASTKEFDRWYDLHDGRHPGEWFVILWTLIIVALIILSALFGGGYKLSSEAVAVYIMVLSIFALTQQSKRLHEEKVKSRGSSSALSFVAYSAEAASAAKAGKTTAGKKAIEDKQRVNRPS